MRDDEYLVCCRVWGAGCRVQGVGFIRSPGSRLDRARDSWHTDLFVPWASGCPRPFENLEVTATRRRCADLVIPRAAVVVEPHEHVEDSCPGGGGARALVPRQLVRLGPPQYVQLSVHGRVGAHRTVAHTERPTATVRRVCDSSNDFRERSIRISRLLFTSCVVYLQL